VGGITKAVFALAKLLNALEVLNNQDKKYTTSKNKTIIIIGFIS
jgi:hypothetical protein